MVLISKEDKNEVVVDNFYCWDVEFALKFIEKMEKYGWKKEIDQQIICPLNWSILRKKGSKYPYDKKLFNPYYEILYKQHKVGVIEVYVGAWSTFYQWRLCEELVSVVDHLPFDKIVNDCIFKFLLQ
jgi:hypothetical protein